LALFTGLVVNKVDRKGRVSVPAPFRAALTGQSFHGIVAYPAADGTRAIEGCGIDWLEQLSARFATANPFAPQFRNVQMAIFSNVDQLNFDGEGRVLLTPKLIEHANITEQAAFVGLGDKFQIWRPEALEQARGNAIRQAIEEMATLELPPAPPGGKG
jgi:MraZ protein